MNYYLFHFWDAMFPRTINIMWVSSFLVLMYALFSTQKVYTNPETLMMFQNIFLENQGKVQI